MPNVVPTQRPTTTWMSRPRFGTVLLVLAFAASQVHLAMVRLFDPDEFEHVHAGLSLAWGQVPYRDFFEHHGPLTYFLSLPLVWIWGVDLDLLVVHRGLALLFTMATLAAVWSISRRLAGRWSGLIALGWLATCPWYVEKTVEWRPDVPATTLLTWGCFLLLVRRSSLAPIAAGALLAGALGFTQKALFPVTGLVVGAVWSHWSRNENRLSLLARIAAGGLTVAVGVLGWFLWNGALDDLVRCTIELPLHWPRTGGVDPSATLHYHWFGLPGWSPVHQALGALGLAIGILSIGRPTRRRRGELVVTIGCLVHWAGAAITPAVYLQYYLLGLGLLAVQVACSLRRFLPTGHRFGRGPGWLPITLATANLWLGMGWRIARGDSGPLVAVNLYTMIDLIAVAASVLALAGVLVSRKWGIRLLWLTLLVPSLGRVAIPHVYWSAEGQRRDLRAVMALVPPNEKILDGFTGLGCLRPHAFYWWWLNHHSIPLLIRQGDLPALVDTIERGVPALILWNDAMEELSDALGPALRERYRPIARPPSRQALFLLRKDLSDPTAMPQPAIPGFRGNGP